MKNKADIKRVAQQVRKELESFVGKNGFNSQPHLGGLCGYGAVMLHEALTKAGYKTKIAQGGGHYFTICEGYLVDVTASQFGQAKVVVRDYERVKRSINSGEYQMNWWYVHGLHDNPCAANVCNLKEQIKNARVNKKQECMRCGEAA